MPARPISHAMTTTAPAIEGYRATKTLGVVRGLTVRSRSVFGTIGASLQTLVGGNISLLTSLCEKTREDSFAQMLEHAQEREQMLWSRSITMRPKSCPASPRCFATAPPSFSPPYRPKKIRGNTSCRK